VLISAQIKIKTRKDNVAGVNLPVFESYQVGVRKFFSCLFLNRLFVFLNSILIQDGADAHELAGLAKGGQQIKRLKVNYGKRQTDTSGSTLER
jgi:V-type H+-transporting ATPase subunit D